MTPNRNPFRPLCSLRLCGESPFVVRSLEFLGSEFAGEFSADREYIRQKEVGRTQMKQLFRYLLLPILGLGLTAVRSAEPSNVRISFVQPERFSDFRIQGRQEIVSAAIFRDDVSTYLSPIVAKRFPGCTLSLKFTNIDLAGRIATSHPLKLNNVRIDRNVASPLRLYFDYQLSDSHGRTLAAGEILSKVVYQK
jgi:hypothetical protein